MKQKAETKNFPFIRKGEKIMSAVTETSTKVEKTTKGTAVFNVRSLTIIGMLSAISGVLMLFEIPMWFAPSFYKMDLSELPVLIGCFALGPVAGIMIEFIKILLNFVLNGTITAGIGELANFLMGCALILPASIIYYKKKTKQAAITGLAVGTVALVIVGSILNAYVLLPAYATAFHMPIEELVKMGSVVNKNITGLNSFVIFAVAPFNLLKGVVVSVLTMLLYKKISPIIKAHH